VCELHVHGSRAVIKGVFASLIDLGHALHASSRAPDSNLTYNKQSQIRLAERGEFTKRAFDNGRLDLTEAEVYSYALSHCFYVGIFSQAVCY
jgi:tRNA modification GTPase